MVDWAFKISYLSILCEGERDLCTAGVQSVKKKKKKKSFHEEGGGEGEGDEEGLNCFTVKKMHFTEV